MQARKDKFGQTECSVLLSSSESLEHFNWIDFAAAVNKLKKTSLKRSYRIYERRILVPEREGLVSVLPKSCKILLLRNDERSSYGAIT